MGSCGGMSDVQHIHAYHVWVGITYLFLVSSCLLAFISGTETFVATTVDVERVFSRGRLILPHVRSRLAVQSTRASLCVGLWSTQGLVKDGDVKVAVGVAEVSGEEDELAMDWDKIPIL
jgi:hypothetical protein